MRKFVIILLLLGGCASSYVPSPSDCSVTLYYDSAWDDGKRPSDIAHICSNNARLTGNFIADLNSKSLEDIRNFLKITQAAWSETAYKLVNVP